MSFVLNVDAGAWYAHLTATADAICAHQRTSLVPVVKSNGYGLGQARATQACAPLAADVIATGTIFEVDDVLANSLADVLVLERFDGRDRAAGQAWVQAAQRWDAARLIRTISTSAGLQEILDGPHRVRIVLEGRTSMHRFGFSPDELEWTVAQAQFRQAVARGQIEVLGLSLHLPLAQPKAVTPTAGVTPRVAEVLHWCGIWQAQELSSAHDRANAVWVSHLGDEELAHVRAGTDLALQVRMGTRLWLGCRDALTARGTVLAVHPLPSGTQVGYRQRSGPRDGTVIVVSGGTAHGIGLTAPTAAANWRQRAVSAGTGALDATGRALSPFSWQGKQRWFAEPPHQHHSMLWLPRGCVLPVIGDELSAEVRYTTSRFDAILGLD